MKRKEFENLVKEGLKDLPEKIRQKIENVAICVEKRPTQEQLQKVGVRYSGSLLGLYEGVPRTKWGRGFGMILPDKITIFQEAIENLAKSDAEMKEIVKYVVWHEIAHHFGYDEKEIKLLEKKKFIP